NGVVQSAAIQPQQISLYDKNDKLYVLSKKDFSIVFQSPTAWLIEFYASWCGHCIHYAQTYREIAIDTYGWSSVVRIGAVNCNSPENEQLCIEHQITGYPTLRVFPPDAIFNKSKTVDIPENDAKSVEKALIDNLETFEGKQKYWPPFTPVSSTELSEFYSRISPNIKLIVLILEQKDDYIGRQIMLDFSKYHDQLAIYRTTNVEKVWEIFQLSMEDIPSLYIVYRNSTIERLDKTLSLANKSIDKHNLFNYVLRSYIRAQSNLIQNYNDDELEEIILRKKMLNTNNTVTTRKQEIIIDKSNTEKVYMVDLECGLDYMLRREICKMKELKNDVYIDLVKWLTVLAKYFPGREPVMIYLTNLVDSVKSKPDNFTGSQFKQMASMKTKDAYLPTCVQQWHHCSGSKNQYRGYPCAVWLIFHTLTVRQVQFQEKRLIPFKQLNKSEIPLAIKNYVKHFFGCRECSDHFMKETVDVENIQLNKYETIFYLWNIHNRVNQRLRGDLTEDPLHPKLQFPPIALCKQCHESDKDNDTLFNKDRTIEFLLKFYSKDNIDTSNLTIISHDQHQKKEDLSHGERFKKMIKKTGDDRINDVLDSFSKYNTRTMFFSRITTIKHFKLYCIFTCLALVIFLRYKFCKVKKKRYTL
ncbi:unnamed protein product, partial [Didymodactylos carnosus]